MNVPVPSGYFRSLLHHHGLIRFLGLGSYRESTQDVDIDALWIMPRVSAQHLTPEAFTADYAKAEAATLPVLAALKEHPRVVLLGDPGSGKSTLINWLCIAFTRESIPFARAALGPLVPIPIILRDLDLSGVTTWRGLLEQWLTRPVARAWNGDVEALLALAQKGQALFMLDGVDEVGGADARRVLRDLLWQGMDDYPDARMLITSRIVGYEECECHQLAFDVSTDQGKADLRIHLKLQLSGKLDARQTSKPRAGLHYLAPFNNDQVATFAQRWFRLYGSNEELADTSSGAFLGDIRSADHMKELARSPILLTLMSLIYRANLRLPEARHLLFAAVSAAYMEGLPLLKGQSGPFSLEEKEELLGALAFQAQLLRCGKVKQERKVKQDKKTKKAKKEEDKTGDILIAEPVILGWLHEALREKVEPADVAPTAERFLHFLSRRAGLFLPRGQDAEGRELYAFLHLSFQEYFAARWMLRQLEADDWLQENRYSATDTTSPCCLPRLREWSADSRWQETLLLMLLLRRDTHLFMGLFAHPPTARAADSPRASLLAGLQLPGEVNLDTSVDRAVLFARAARDPYVDLPLPLRDAALSAAWHWVFHYSEKFIPSSVNARLLAPGSLQTRARAQFSEACQLHPHATSLDLSGCMGLTALPELASLVQLQRLRLDSCTGITALTELAGLAQLQRLFLNGCTGLTALSELSSLARLQWLELSSCTGPTALPGLAGLSELQVLGLSSCTGLTALPELAGLAQLQVLWLDGCTGLTALPDLSGLAQLKVLFLNRCTGLTTLPDLARLAQLQHLDLTGCTGLTGTPRVPEGCKVIGP